MVQSRMAVQTGQHVQVLQKIGFFRGVEDDDLSEVLRQATIRKSAQGDFLFHQGDPANVFYIVIKGQIKLTQVNSEGEQVVLHYPGPGNAFGIVAVLREVPFPVSAQAVEDSELLAWDEATLRDLMFEYPQLSINAIRLLSRFIQDFQNRIGELSSENVTRRVARAFLRIAEQAGRKIDQGVEIDIRLTRQDIAEMSGTTLYSVSRIMSGWERDKLIRSQSGRITILQPHKLVAIAEDLADPKA